MSPQCYIGIDIGTSGCRAIAINDAGKIVAEQRQTFTPVPQGRQNALLWWHLIMTELLPGLLTKLGAYTPRAIAVDGTSATTLLCDADANPCSPALMYDYPASSHAQQTIAALAPHDSPARGATSALAKTLDLLNELPRHHHYHIQHQADWIYGRLCGLTGISDSNNCLKLGYDPVHESWPGWLTTLLDKQQHILPRVIRPGTPIAPLSNQLADQLGLPRQAVKIVAGSTDSVAGFLASGAHQIGDAVTTLGSTLVLKILSAEPINAPHFGVYSHRFGDYWLTGGASNCGAAILRRYFTTEQLTRLSLQIDPERDSGLDYYPLCTPGERFPWNDPARQPRLSPRPSADSHFLHGLLEGLARVEARGYARLHELAAPRPTTIISNGGGAINKCWQAIRQRILAIPVVQAKHSEAAFGAALLARQPFQQAGN